jgi:hypothetical protein
MVCHGLGFLNFETSSGEVSLGVVEKANYGFISLETQH